MFKNVAWYLKERRLNPWTGDNLQIQIAEFKLFPSSCFKTFVIIE